MSRVVQAWLFVIIGLFSTYLGWQLFIGSGMLMHLLDTFYQQVGVKAYIFHNINMYVILGFMTFGVGFILIGFMHMMKKDYEQYPV